MEEFKVFIFGISDKLTLKFNQGVNYFSVKILFQLLGKQYRTVSCRWGGRPCLNHPSFISTSQPFCDEFDVSKQFCEEENNKFLDTYLCTILSHQLACCEPNSFVSPCHKVFAITNSRKYR